MILLLAAIAAMAGPAPVVHGVAYPDIMPIGQVRPGMKGYGLTVFRGTKVERFDVTVVAVVRNGSLIAPGHDMILIRMAGGPMTERGANLIRGMSGSPIYIHGKCIGAFSQGEPTTKEPLGGVTPIEDMLEAWDPRLPSKIESRADPHRGPRIVELSRPIRDGRRIIRRIAFDAEEDARTDGTTLRLRPCVGMVTISGGSRRSLARLKDLLEPYGVEVMQTPAGKSGAPLKGGALVPGAAFSTLLLKGDVETGATGTVTYRRGNRLLGLGHPFLGIGPLTAPICPATVHDVYPLSAGSYKISTPGPTLGMTLQDRLFGLSAVVGQRPAMIPVTVNVDDRTTGRSKTYRMEAVSHPNLTAGLIGLAVGSAIADMHGTPGPVTARIETVVEADELGRLERRNCVYDARAVDLAATADLDSILSVVVSNPFQPLNVRSASVTCVIEPGRRTATIERVAVKSLRYKPGDTVEVEVTLKPHRGEPLVRTTSIGIPESAPAGQLTLTVRGGGAPAAVSVGGIVFRPSTGPAPDQSPPTSARQMIERLLEREAGDEVGVRLALPTSGVTVDGRTLSGLPPTLDAALRSPRVAGTRIDRDEVRSVIRTEWVVTGQQTVTITVQREPVPTAQARPVAPSGSEIAPPATADAGSRLASDFALAHEQGQTRPRPAGVATDSATSKQVRDGQGQAAQPSPSPAEPPKADAGGEKPVARTARSWRHTARTDWVQATRRGVGITSEGDAVPVARAVRICTLPAAVVWCLAPDGDGGVYAGVGPEAAVYHVRPDGQTSLVARLPEVSVHALLRASDGALYAGTAPNGRTYKIASGTDPVVVHDAEESYVLSLAAGPDGTVYVGAGGPAGAVYRIRPSGDCDALVRSVDRHVQAVAVDEHGEVWIGTSGRGLVVKIGPNGQERAVFSAPGQSVTSLLPMGGSGLLAATGPKASLLRIGDDGSAREVGLSGSSAVMGLARLAGDRAVAVGGATAAVIQGELRLPLEVPSGAEVLCVVTSSDGTIWMGTANSGDVLCAPKGTGVLTGEVESVVLDAGVSARWGRLRWTGAASGGGSVLWHTRSGNSSEPDRTWSAWSPLRKAQDGGDILSPPARYLQYRATLLSPVGEARAAVRDVTVTYLPQSRPPVVSFQSPSGGERWSGAQTLRWQASDPDGDTLAFDVTCSADGGVTWQSVPAVDEQAAGRAAAPVKETPARPAATVPSGARRPLSVEQVTAELDKHPGLPPAMREAILDRTRNLNADYEQSAGQAPAPAPASGSTRDTSRKLDTRKLADGVYRFRVVASDRPSNWEEAQTTTAVSEPVVICNSAPVVHVLRSQIVITGEGRVRLEAVVVQPLIPVTAAQWRVDGKEWMAARPVDGFADGGVETFAVETEPLQPGKRVLELKAFNAAGLATTEKLEIEIPARKG